VRYELGFSIPEDGILHSHDRMPVPQRKFQLEGTRHEVWLHSNSLTQAFIDYRYTGEEIIGVLQNPMYCYSLY
jgi:hypothetical protein